MCRHSWRSGLLLLFGFHLLDQKGEEEVKQEEEKEEG